MGHTGKQQPSHICLHHVGFCQIGPTSHLLFLVEDQLCCYLYPEIITLSIVRAKSLLKKRTLRAIRRMIEMQLGWSLSSDDGFWPNDKQLPFLSVDWQLNSLSQHALIYLLIDLNCQDAPKLSSLSHFLWLSGKTLAVGHGPLLITSSSSQRLRSPHAQYQHSQ